MKKSILKTLGISKILPKTGHKSSIPGTVRYVGKKRKERVKLHIMNYNEKDFSEKTLKSVTDEFQFKGKDLVTWLNVTGVHNENIIHDIGNKFEIHPLVLEDIANTTQRPKVEEYDSYFYTVIKMAYFNKETSEVTMEQVSLLVGNGYVVSLQEKEGDILDGLRESIRNNKGKIRKLGSDYLMYGIIDAVVDNYFSVLEHIGEEIENLEVKLMRSTDQRLLTDIYNLKKELVFLRKSIWPMREVVNTLQRTEHPLINENIAIYLRDVYDHTIQVVETVETFRDMTSGMLDLYLSTMSNKMNEVMKVLTMFAAIFIPLTFLAGVYGMNFKYMPELGMRLAYPAWWVFTTVLAIGMVIYFKRKRWM